MLNFIVWDANPEMFTIPGLDHPVRWYGLMFALAFLVGQQLMFYIYRKEGQPEKDVERLTIYMVIATVLGARLGHVLFYEPEKYLPDPLSIFKIWEGGLASHGAAIGILLGIYLYSRKHFQKGQNFMWVVDRIVIIVALAGAFIRFGNFMNSEILGKPTESNSGVVFARGAEEMLERSAQEVEKVEIYANEDAAPSEAGLAPLTVEVQFTSANFQEQNLRSFIERTFKNVLTDKRYSRIAENIREPENEPLQYTLKQERVDGGTAYVARIQTMGVVRHPAQFYESMSCVLLFFILFYVWYRKKNELKQGTLFGIFLIYIFGLRFFYEFLKENQVAFEDQLPLNMGQWLSIPLVIAGIIILFTAKKKNNRPGKLNNVSQKA